MSGAGQKRKFTGSSDGNKYKHSRRDDEIEQSHTQGKLDLIFGQRSVFPGLDDYTLTGDDTLDHDDELGALSYLRSVREEASTIPTVLTAPKTHSDDRAIYEDGTGDSRGWYSQGAYTAAPLSTTSGTSEYDDKPTGRDPQTVFYESLISKYQTLRTQINQTPPKEIKEKLDQAIYPTHVRQCKEGTDEWNLRLRNNAPHPVQLAVMKKWSVLRLLTILTTEDAVLRRGREINENTSLWLWGLLAKVPERGEMNSEQIAVVRELGKKAVLVGVGFKEAEEWGEGLDVLEEGMRGGRGGGGEDGENGEAAEDAGDAEVDIDMNLDEQPAISEEDLPTPKIPEPLKEQIGPAAPSSKSAQTLQSPPPSDTANYPVPSTILTPDDPEVEDLAAAKARLLNAMNSDMQDAPPQPETDTSVPTKNTRVTLDMILTVAGEVYGQRDLLEFREKWDEVEDLGTY